MPAVTAGLCIFVKYDRSFDLLHFVVPSAPAPLQSTPIIFRPQAITDFPLYLSAPVLFGVATAIYASLSGAATFIGFLCRVAYRGHMGSSGRNARYRLAAIALLFGLIIGTGCLAKAAYRLRTVSHAAVFGKLATNWIDLYVGTCGQWPRSWDTLRDCASLDGSDPESLLQAVQSYIEVDFHADLRVLATQSAEEFQAVRVRDGYGVDHHEYWEVRSLIATISNLSGGAASTPQPQRGSSLGGADPGKMVD